MPEQLLLLNAPPPSVPKYSPVLAVFPDGHVTQQISNRGNQLRTMYDLYRKLRPTDHLHVSLPFPTINKYAPKTAFANILCACAAVAPITNPFEIKFDWVKSFRGKPGNCPLVLVNENNHENAGIMNLARLLCKEFARFGLKPPPVSSFSPHLTVLYDKREFASTPVAPVSWMVKEFALVLSEVGATKYHECFRWELGKQDSYLTMTQAWLDFINSL